MKRAKKVFLLITLLVTMVVTLAACSSSSSSYSLHNKDGSLNMKYVTDMNNYFKKHKK